jgi:hypothetical protein
MRAFDHTIDALLLLDVLLGFFTGCERAIALPIRGFRLRMLPTLHPACSLSL